MTSKLLCKEHLTSDHNFYFCCAIHLYKICRATLPVAWPSSVQIRKKQESWKTKFSHCPRIYLSLWKLTFFPLNLVLDSLRSLHLFLVWGNSRKRLCLGQKGLYFKLNSWKALVRASTHVTQVPLGAQVKSVTYAYTSSISHSVSKGRFEYTDTLSRWKKSEVPTYVIRSQWTALPSARLLLRILNV